MRLSKDKERVRCFGECGVELTCKCSTGYVVNISAAESGCQVHGSYGSLCSACLSHLVASTLS